MFPCRHAGCNTIKSTAELRTAHERRFPGHFEHACEHLRGIKQCQRCNELRDRSIDFSQAMAKCERAMRKGRLEAYAKRIKVDVTLARQLDAARVVSPSVGSSPARVFSLGPLVERQPSPVASEEHSDDGASVILLGEVPVSPLRTVARMADVEMPDISAASPEPSRKRPREETDDQNREEPPLKKASARPAAQWQDLILPVLAEAEGEIYQGAFEFLLKSAQALFLTADAIPAAVYTAVARAFTAGLRRFGASSAAVSTIVAMWHELSLSGFSYDDIAVNRELLVALCGARVPETAQRGHVMTLLVRLVQGSIYPDDNVGFLENVNAVFVTYVAALLDDAETSADYAEHMLAQNYFGNGVAALSPYHQYRLLAVILGARQTTEQVLPRVLEILESIENALMVFGTPAENATHMRSLITAVRAMRRTPASLQTELSIVNAIATRTTDSSFHHNASEGAARKRRGPAPLLAGIGIGVALDIQAAPLRMHDSITMILEVAEKEPDARRFENLLFATKFLFAAAGVKGLQMPHALYIPTTNAFAAGLLRFSGVSAVLATVLEIWAALSGTWDSGRDARASRALLMALCQSPIPRMELRLPGFSMSADLVRSCTRSGNEDLSSQASATFLEYARGLLSDADENPTLANRMLNGNCFSPHDEALETQLQYRLLRVFLSAPGVTGALLGGVLDVVSQLHFDASVVYARLAEDIKHLDYAISGLMNDDNWRIGAEIHGHLMAALTSLVARSNVF